MLLTWQPEQVHHQRDYNEDWKTNPVWSVDEEIVPGFWDCRIILVLRLRSH
jgi:hypothetical protein